MCVLLCHDVMMTLSNGNIFRVTGPLWGEFTGHRCILLTKKGDLELWYLVWYDPERMVEQTVEIPVIWGVIWPIVTSLIFRVIPLGMNQSYDLSAASMGNLPDTQNCGLRMRDARDVMHAMIANQWVPLNSVAGKTLPAFPVYAQTAV